MDEFKKLAIFIVTFDKKITIIKLQQLYKDNLELEF